MAELLTHDGRSDQQPRAVVGSLRLRSQCAGSTPRCRNISVANFFTLGQAITGPLAGDNIYGLRDVFSTTRGRHTINAGAEVYLEKDRLETLLNNYGAFSFTSAAVPTTASGQATYTRTGVAMADFLIGHPNTMSQDSPDNANANYWNYGFFLQDDWRVFPRLTLNLGVRYDVQTAPTDTQRRIAVFEPGVQSKVSPNAMLGQLFPGDPGVPDGGVDTNYNHFHRVWLCLRCRQVMAAQSSTEAGGCSSTPYPATNGCCRRTSNHSLSVRPTRSLTLSACRISIRQTARTLPAVSRPFPIFTIRLIQDTFLPRHWFSCRKECGGPTTTS